MFPWLCAMAGAADLHLTLDMDGLVQEVVWPSQEALSKRYGPVEIGKSSAIFLITAPGSVFDPLEGAYRVELSVCIEWTRKRDHDQYCDRKELFVPDEQSTVRHEVAVKAKDKYEWRVEMWYTGEAPPTGLPTEAQDPASQEPDPEADAPRQ
jgi:hypothetical protein